MEPAPSKSKLCVLGRVFVAFAFCPLLGGIIAWFLLRPVDVGRGVTQLGLESVYFREISHARLVAEWEDHDQLPPETLANVYTFAGYLARLRKHDILHEWVSAIDPAWLLRANRPKSILVSSQGGLPASINPDFQDAPVTVAIALWPTAINLPPETPVTWTRGLQADGTWRDDSPYYGTGGFIGFANGDTRFFATLRGAPLRKWGTNEPTSNIIEALPTGTRISEFVPPAEVAAYVHALKRPPVISLVMSSSLMLTCSLIAAGVYRKSSPEMRRATPILGVLCAAWFWFTLFHSPVNDLIHQAAVSLSEN